MTRMSVNFSDEALSVLKELAADSSMSEVMRRAISFEKWKQQVYREGGRILVERDGKIREVVMR